MRYYFILLMFSFNSYALSATKNIENNVEKEFIPHITVTAKTRKKGAISIGRSPMNNVNSNPFLFNASYALSDYLEIGMVPFQFFASGHKFNLNLKYNFYNSDEISLAFSIGTVILKADIPSHADIIFLFNNLKLTMNYSPQLSDLRFGFYLSNTSIIVRDKDNITNNDKYIDKYEWGLDNSYSITEKIDIILGLGQLRQYGLSAYENSYFGFGSSIGWHRPGNFFSSPTFGVHYTPDTDRFSFMISSSIK